jgi:hypothetical protein
MRSFSTLIDPGGRPLTEHVEQLRRTLDSLCARLRESLAQAVSGAVADMLRDTLRRVLTELASRPPALDQGAQPLPRRPPMWASPYDPAYEDNLDDYLPEYLSEADLAYLRRREAPLRATEPAQAAPVCLGSWSLALSAGLQAAGYWLHRRPGGWNPLVVLGVGAAAGAIVLVGGPVALTGIRLAGSALSLAGLEACLRSPASLTPPSTS